jgi:EpsI family protein
MVSLSNGITFPVVKTVIEREHQRQLVFYWYEQRGRRIANEYLMKVYLLIDALTLNRTDGALVRVTTPLRPYEPIEVAESRLLSFMELTVPELQKYVPK